MLLGGWVLFVSVENWLLNVGCLDFFNCLLLVIYLLFVWGMEIKRGNCFLWFCSCEIIVNFAG